MPVVWTIARKELADGLRNRWLLAISLLFALLSVGIAWFGAAAAGQVGFTSVPATVASLTSLATFLMPLIALLLAYDAIVGEEEGGTLLLLLTYPLGRGQLLLGKFLGHGLILALATLIGFGSAALAILALVPEVEAAILLGAFGRFMGSSLLLGCVFLALAYALSSRASEKSSAAGQALGLWFFFVLLFDLALLAILVLSQGHLSPRLLPWLLLLNPTDLYRLINLSGFDAAAAGGVVPLASDLPVSASALWLALALWACAALALAHGLFRRRPSDSRGSAMQRHTLPLRPLLGTLLLGLLLAGCDASRDDATALGPVPIASGDECHVCGMLIEEMPGPKGEAVLPGAVRKFCSTAELFGWWLQPENRQGQARLYVHDMSQADWRHPDDARLIDATRAYYVVGIQRPGGMGATLASFADEEAATRLAAEEGGRVLRFDEIDQAVLQGVGGDHPHRHPAH